MCLVAETLDKFPESVHAPQGVEYLARLAGFEGDRLPAICIFDEAMGFSEVTAFIRTSSGNGYYQTTLNGCSCPDWRHRKVGTGQMCKHQQQLCEALKKREEKTAKSSPSLPQGVVGMTLYELAARKARITERNRRRAEGRPSAPKPSAPKGFNLPPDDDFPAKLAEASR